jgi:hypothetical protein
MPIGSPVLPWVTTLGEELRNMVVEMIVPKKWLEPRCGSIAVDGAVDGAVESRRTSAARLRLGKLRAAL